jgi:hypothetical protein
VIVPSIHRSGAVVVADRPRFARQRQRTELVRIGLIVAAAVIAALLFATAKHAGAGRAAVFPESADTGVITLDMSASISGPIYARVATVLRGIISANQSVGLVMFSDSAYELLPPNSPPTALEQFIPYFIPARYYGSSPIFNQAPWDTFMGGTRAARGLRMAADSLRRAGVKHGAILLVSDLDDAAADEGPLEQEAARLKQQHIPVRIVPEFASPANKREFASLFGENAFVDPRVFAHSAKKHAQPIAAPAPWKLIGLGALLVLLLAANERFVARLETA